MTTTGSTRARLAGRRAATTERSKLERAATLDPLTGLLTRTKAADHFAQLRRGGQASTLILVDLDYVNGPPTALGAASCVSTSLAITGSGT